MGVGFTFYFLQRDEWSRIYNQLVTVMPSPLLITI